MQTKYRFPYKNLLSKKINERIFTDLFSQMLFQTYEFILLGR